MCAVPEALALFFFEGAVQGSPGREVDPGHPCMPCPSVPTWVRVLQEGDHHEPVVDNEVGDEVRLQQPHPAKHPAQHHQAHHHDGQRQVADEHLPALLLSEDGREGVKVVGEPAGPGTARQGHVLNTHTVP